MKSNVWYISKYANVEKYGADTRQANFCKEFAKAAYKVRLITSNSSHLYSHLPKFKKRYFDTQAQGFSVTWVNTPGYSKTASIRRIIGWLWFDFFVIMMSFNKKFEKPDVVIASSLSLFTVVTGCFYKKFYNARFIFEVRDIWPQTLIDLKGLSSKHPLTWLLKKIERLGYKYSDVIVGTMPGLHLHVENEVGLGSKVHFIPHGLNSDFYDSKQEKLSEEYIQKYIPKNKFVVTYTGTFGEANALEYVIEAAKKLQHSSKIHFLLVGDGYLKEGLEYDAEGLMNVTFAPVVAKEQVHHLLSLSDLLVASVRDRKIYRFGVSLNKLIDYMYARKPIVCMYSGYQSMINEAKCGEFTPAEDSNIFAETIERYQLMNSLDRERVGDLGYKFLVNERSLDVLSKKYMKLFN